MTMGSIQLVKTTQNGWLLWTIWRWAFHIFIYMNRARPSFFLNNSFWTDYKGRLLNIIFIIKNIATPAMKVISRNNGNYRTNLYFYITSMLQKYFLVYSHQYIIQTWYTCRYYWPTDQYKTIWFSPCFITRWKHL